MTKLLNIIALLFTSFAFGQVSRENIYKNVNGLILVDSVSWQDIVGGFSVSDGLAGFKYRLDSTMAFQKIAFDCVSKFKVDSGSWTIRDQNTVILNSKKRTLFFDILKLDKFYFFILPTQRQKFITDLKAARIKFNNAKPLNLEGRTYMSDFWVGYSLAEKYFAKGIEELAGT